MKPPNATYHGAPIRIIDIHNGMRRIVIYGKTKRGRTKVVEIKWVSKHDIKGEEDYTDEKDN